MAGGKKFNIFESSIAHFIDGIVAAITGVVLFYFGMHDLAVIAVVVGGLLTVSRIVQSSFIRESLAPVQKMSEILDLDQKCAVAEIDSLLKAYLSIQEDEFRAVKDTILIDTTAKFRRLASEKRSDELGTSEYFTWLLPIIEGVRKGSSISAVSCMFDSEWDDFPAEAHFLKANIDAAQRGARVERVFIVSEEKISATLQNEAVKAHAIEVNNKVSGFVVAREYLEKHDPQLLKDVGDGFISFSGRVALIDRFSQDGMVRGTVTMNESDIRRLDHVFARLKLHARDLSISMATALLAPAGAPMKAIGPPVPSAKEGNA